MSGLVTWTYDCGIRPVFRFLLKESNVGVFTAQRMSRKTVPGGRQAKLRPQKAREPTVARLMQGIQMLGVPEAERSFREGMWSRRQSVMKRKTVPGGRQAKLRPQKAREPANSGEVDARDSNAGSTRSRAELS